MIIRGALKTSHSILCFRGLKSGKLVLSHFFEFNGFNGLGFVYICSHMLDLDETCIESDLSEHIKECFVTILKVLQIIFKLKNSNNFVNESHLLIWGKLQLGLIR